DALCRLRPRDDARPGVDEGDGGRAGAGDSEDAELPKRHGDATEAYSLARFRAAGRGVVEIVQGPLGRR
ncbi:MAG: hypothetical protein ACOYD4_17895, partial [Solirubrobacterales bacterium]